MKRLREVSNTSKHVDLVLVKAEYSRLRGTAWDGEYDETQGGFIEGREVNVEEVTADISFPGRTPVIDELQLMQAQVAQIFEEFKTLFVRAGQRNRS
jgi:hypothetical protein